MTYVAFVADVVLALLVLIILSLNRRFEHSNALLGRMGRRAESPNCDYAMSDEFEEAMKAHFGLLETLAVFSKIFQVGS